MDALADIGKEVRSQMTAMEEARPPPSAKAKTSVQDSTPSHQRGDSGVGRGSDTLVSLPAEHIIDRKAALEAKENLISSKLLEKQKKVMKEAETLRVIESELAKLRMQEAEGINILRNQLERIDKELYWLDRDFKQKKEAFEEAEKALKAKNTEKDGVQKDLVAMVMSSEKKKEEALNKLISKIGQS